MCAWGNMQELVGVWECIDCATVVMYTDGVQARRPGDLHMFELV